MMSVRQDRRFYAMRMATRKMKPTLKHRPIITPGILGTWYGINPDGEVQYFDYKYDKALDFAEVTARRAEQWRDIDLRLSTPKLQRWEGAYHLPGYDMWHPERCITKRTRAWWVNDGKKNW